MVSLGGPLRCYHVYTLERIGVRELRQDRGRAARAAAQQEAAPSDVSEAETPEAVEEPPE